MKKDIEQEIVEYLNENDMYFVEEYDKEGFPVNDEANDLIGYMTNAELCECITDAMEYIAEVQRKKDIERLKEILNYLMIDTKDKVSILTLMRNEQN